MTASYKELLQQRQSLDQQIAEARKVELKGAIEKVRTLVAEFGLSMDAVFPKLGRVSAAKGSSVAPKYRDPETGKTWTGRGKAPLWIADKPDRDQFLIK